MKLTPFDKPPNYVVKDGVRLTSTGKPSRELGLPLRTAAVVNSRNRRPQSQRNSHQETSKCFHSIQIPCLHVQPGTSRTRSGHTAVLIAAEANACLTWYPGITDHRHISRIVGTLWKNLPPETKKVWEGLAEKEKEEHRKYVAFSYASDLIDLMGNPDKTRTTSTSRRQGERPQSVDVNASKPRKKCSFSLCFSILPICSHTRSLPERTRNASVKLWLGVCGSLRS